MRMGGLSILKTALVLMVVFFLIKVGSSFIKNKFPNKITSNIDTVVQRA